MPSRAWVVTARMSNILNFSWCFLCIPAIYRCILAYLPIFFNQLSKFLRCESPSTFLGTCLSHHSFIIFLVTNTNTLLSGLYLISTKKTLHFQSHLSLCVNALSGLYLISTHIKYLLSAFSYKGVNALSGLYLISTGDWRGCIWSSPIYVSMPSRAYTSFLLRYGLFWSHKEPIVSMPSRAYTSFLQSFPVREKWSNIMCQCPLGLIPHFYGTPSKT